ncbi:MAG: RNA-binding S4 domain-containing protein [Oscillospiraceae bacterium]|jgi:ribosome-associated protein|nr:RNA-binding S4 domain-containing protein [Oscillospiraceae bacterium]
MLITLRVKAAESVIITTPSIRLEAFLKFCGAVESGGQAKVHIVGGELRVNGELCTQRGRQLRPGDRVTGLGGAWQVVAA